MSFGLFAALAAAGSAIVKGVSSNDAGADAWWAAQEQAALGEAQAKVGRIQADINVALIDDQARDVQHVAAGQKRLRMTEAGRTIGSQMAGAAAQGIDVASAAVRAATSEAALLGELDALMIENNAARQVYGLRTERENQRFAGRMSEIVGYGAAQQIRAGGDAAMSRGALGAVAAGLGFAVDIGMGAAGKATAPKHGNG